MDWLKNPIFSYIGLFIAFCAVILGVVKPEWASWAWTFAGFLGVGSFDLLRTMVDSNGWKTHAVFIVVGIGSLLQIFGVVDAAVIHTIMVAFSPILGITFQQALAKSPTSTIPLLTFKKAA